MDYFATPRKPKMKMPRKPKMKMLTNTFRILVNNLFKENFYKKKVINILTVFIIFYKSGIKIFLK